ncbi:hypothetical protein BC834DRAFT_1016460 [Gloeopeniophorella convolvens]|nr:hypothetical protein BC834DRAFT_1016460 [Gloeopeniophorella convolvens]
MVTQQVEQGIKALDAIGVTPADFLLDLLTSPISSTLSVILTDLADQADNICSALLKNNITSKTTQQWVVTTAGTLFSNEIRLLADKDNGWHFSGILATIGQIQDFRISQMITDMKRLSPETWSLVGSMLGSQKSHEVHLLEIKQLAVISIMMQSMNQHCNLLGSIIGLFLHTCNTPEKVIKVLSRIGASVSGLTRGVRTERIAEGLESVTGGGTEDELRVLQIRGGTH